MSNFFLALASSIDQSDTSLRNSYITNGSATIYWAFNLMNIQAGWQPYLDQCTSNAVIASMQEGGAGQAAFWQSEYQVYTQQKDSQNSVWQNLVQEDQTQIDNDTDARKGNFSLAQGLAGTAAQCISIANFN